MQSLKLWLAILLAGTSAVIIYGAEEQAAPVSATVTASASQPMLATPGVGGPTARSGNAPLFAPTRLTIAGSIEGLPPNVPHSHLEVRADGRAWPIRVEGHRFEADIVSNDPDAMVVVHVRAPRLAYQTNAGSLRRLTALSRGDGKTDYNEATELRVSPITTAIALMAQRIHGRDPASQMELERAFRAMAGGFAADGTVRHTLGEIASLLDRVTTGAFPLGPAHSTGTDLVRDASAFAALDQVELARHGRTYLSDALDSSAIESTSELPTLTMLTSRLPVDQPALSASANLIERVGPELLRLHFGDLGTRVVGKVTPAHPVVDWRLSRSYDSQLILTPQTHDPAWPSHYVTYAMSPENGRMVKYAIIDKRLKRLAAGDQISLYAVTTRWFEVPVEESRPPSYMSSVEVWAATDLVRGSLGDGWAQPVARRALPTFCGQPVSLPASGVALRQCEYQPHRFDAGGVGVVEQSGRDVDDTMRPKLPGAAQTLNWAVADSGRELRVSTAARDEARYWVIDRLANGVDLLAYAATHADLPGQQWVGVVATLPVGSVPLPPEAVTGVWRLAAGGATVMPSIPAYELHRQSDGSSLEYTQLKGVDESPVPAKWEINAGRVYDTRFRAQFAAGSRAVASCAEAFAQGATLCSPNRIRVFKPLGRTGNRVFGVSSFYFQPSMKAAGYTGTYTVSQTPASPMYFDCVAGICLTTTPAEAAGSAPLAYASNANAPQSSSDTHAHLRLPMRPVRASLRPAAEAQRR